MGAKVEKLAPAVTDTTGKGHRCGAFALAVVLLLGFASAVPVAASLDPTKLQAPAALLSARAFRQLAGKVEGHTHNNRRGNSAEIYGGSSADRYGGSSADNGGMAGKVDRRVYGKPKTAKPKNEASRKQGGEEGRQNGEDGDKPEEH